MGQPPLLQRGSPMKSLRSPSRSTGQGVSRYSSELDTALLVYLACRCFFQACLAACSESGEFAYALLLCCPPQLFGCIDAEFFVQASSDMWSNMLNCRQRSYGEW